MKSAQTELPFVVRDYRSEDEPQALNLLTAALGPGPTGARTADFFRWKHFDNPFGPSAMWVAETDGRLVGLRAFLRWRFQVGERVVDAVRAVDTATHPDYLRLGVFSALTREAFSQLGGATGFVFNTPNKKSMPGYLKMGWRAVGHVPLSVMIRGPKGLASVLLHAGRGTPPAAGGEPANGVLADGAAIDELLREEDVRANRFATQRSAEYLRWRYGMAPSLDYRVILASRGSTLDGIAIFRARRRGRLRETMVSELIVRSGDSSVARRLLHAVAKAGDVDHVVAVNPALGRTGRFRSGLVTWRGPVLVVNPLLEGIAPDPSRLDSWALSLGDVEVF